MAGARPDVSVQEFKMGMRYLAAAVNVVSVIEEGAPRGMLATAVCSVCAEPPMLLVCVNQVASLHRSIRETGHFGVSVLDERQFDTACHFMSSAATERFTLCDWDTLVTGAPAIRGALVNFDCEVESSVDRGTHTIYFGRVVAVRRSESGRPLMYHDGNYACLGPEPLVARG
ncbi:MAG: flavin reductase family protein [Hyphomicrobiales bacterium]|nr:flavin reductase family protein [Hyphomicrobiales bacterium]MCP5370603.1 flavin reductase family protein [Hyphomicrobiales bacterium]